MNIRVLGVVLTFAYAGTAWGQLASGMSSSSPTIAERGPHHRVWQSVTQTTDANGESIYQTNSYTEIQTGLHYWDEGQWKESVPEFEFYEGKGFVARRGQIKAILSSRLEPGCVDMETPSGRFRSHILGLSYFDPISGESVVIAQSKGVEGQQVAPNIIIYPDCFDNIHADLRLTITRYGFEQDIILREPITATPESYGLDAKTTQLEGMTEFIELPSGTRQEQVTEVQTNSLVRTLMAVPDQTDDILNFGTTTFGSGRAFMLNDSEGQDVRVNKALRNVDGRTVLFESISYGTAKQMMNKLGSSLKKDSQRQYAVGELKGQVRHSRVLPMNTFPKSEIKQMASLNKPGVVLDYATIETSQTNFAFAANGTYYVSGPVYLYGAGTCISGGAVFKMAPTNSAKIQINTACNWTGGPYRPVVVTARDDNSVGEIISGSTTNPVMYPGPALSFTTSSQIRNLRVSYAQTGIQAASSTTLELTHGQFLKCSNAVQATSANVTLRNVLFHSVTNVFSGGSTVGRCEHLTVNGAGAFNYNNACSSLYVTNSLLAGVTTLGSYTGVSTTTLTSTLGVFETVWGGANYLTAGSPYRNVGTTNVNVSLIKDFKRMTTYAPTFLSSTVSVDTVLGPVVQRETDIPDLGYHYDALDYVFGLYTVTNATLTLTNGVAVAGSNTVTIWTSTSGNLISEGRPDRHNVISKYYCVQEQPYVPAPTGNGSFINNYATAPYPLMSFRFTDFRELADGSSGYFLYVTSYWMVHSLMLKDCEFSGCRVFLGAENNGWVTVTNCLFEYTSIEMRDNTNHVYFYNNLVKGGLTRFYRRSDTNTWWAQNNLFDSLTLSVWLKGPTNSHNAYYNATVLPNSMGNNVVLTNLTYQTGTLGRFYQPTTSSLLNVGSTSASNLGLYHYTTQTNQTKEASSVVDIGYHYVATDSSGVPLDQDGDGLSDYVEDQNGNGNSNDDTNSWQTYNSANGLAGPTSVNVFTPLK